MDARKPQKISILAPTVSRGGTTRAYWLAQVAQEAGLEAEVVASHRPDESLYPTPPADVSVRLLQSQRGSRATSATLDALDGDVVWALKPRPASFGLGLVKRMRARTPLILDIDDLETRFLASEVHAHCQKPPAWVRAKRKFLAFRSPDFGPWVRLAGRLTPLADAITVNSSVLRERFGGTYLPNGKNTRRFDPALHDARQAKEKLGLNGYQCVMFPGTVAQHKGIEDVIAALERIGDSNLKLVVVGGRQGGSNYLSQLGDAARRWLIPLPQVDSDEMPAVLTAADLVVIPQHDSEIARAQTPMKLSDAMAMARPIVATRVGDLPSILDNAAALVPPSDSQALADSIQRVLGDPHYAERLGEAARARCIADFSLPAAASSLRKVIHDLWAGRRDNLTRPAMRAR